MSRVGVIPQMHAQHARTARRPRWVHVVVVGITISAVIAVAWWTRRIDVAIGLSVAALAGVCGFRSERRSQPGPGPGRLPP